MAKNAWGDEEVSSGPKRNAWGDLEESAPVNRSPVSGQPSEPQYGPAEGMSPTEKFLVGAGHGLKRAYQGLRGLPQALVPGLPEETRAKWGGPTPEERDEEALYQRHHPGGWATTGEVAADVLTAAAPVGLAGNVARAGTVLPRALKAGEVAGRAAPVSADIAANAAASYALAPEERVRAFLYGGAGAAAGHALPRAVARAVRPAGELGPDARRLVDAGVQPTLGQVLSESPSGLGRGVSRLEEAATSMPLTGGPVRGARNRAMTEFQQATRAAASPPGAATASTVDDLGKAFHEAYENVLGRTEFGATDQLKDFKGGLDDMVMRTAQDFTVTPKQVGRAQGITAEVFEAAGDNAFTPRGAQFIESRLKQIAANQKGSPDPDVREFGGLLHDIANRWKSEWRGALPEDSRRAIDAIDRQYASFVPVRRAAAQRLTEPEAYTPKQLLKAIQAGDKGPTKSAFRRGGLPQQRLATSAEKVLTSKVPDSGTPERAMAGALLTGGAALLHPAALAPILLSMGYSTRVAQRYLTGQLAPAQQKAVDEALRRYAAESARAGRAVATQEPGTYR